MSNSEMRPIKHEAAQMLLSDVDHQSSLLVVHYDFEAAHGVINGLEFAIADRFGLQGDDNGYHMATFKPDSTWEMLKDRYEDATLTTAREMFALFTPGNLKGDPVVEAEYTVPITALGRGSKAINAAFRYSVKTYNHGKTRREVQKLGRKTTKTPRLGTNPFYSAPEKPTTKGLTAQFSAAEILGNARRSGRAGN